VPDTAKLESLLADSWAHLDGSSASHMTGKKLWNRMENVHWQPPILSFAVERHVAPASSQAVLQHWMVDFHNNTAAITKTEERTLHRLSLRVSVEEAGDEIARAIIEGSNDDRLEWDEDGTACVVASWVVPKESAFWHTLGTRRMKLSNYIGHVLADHGWKKCGRNRFRKDTATWTQP
jgi:hypothetical protein